jgi:hypothetical protein
MYIQPDAKANTLVHVASQRALFLVAQPRLYIAGDGAAISRISLLQVRADPALDIDNLGEVVLGDLLAGVELRETHTEPNVLDVRLGNLVAGTGDGWRVLQKLEQGLAGEAPSLGVLLCECFGI